MMDIYMASEEAYKRGLEDGKRIAKDTNALTNADRIRAMTDEELREFMCSITNCRACPYEKWFGCGLREWLKQPVEEDNG
jgi:hypothetical protein